MSDKQRNPHDAVDYIIHNASKFANAKAARVYLEIPGWPEYEINQDGHVRRVKASFGTRPMKTVNWCRMSNGYAKVSLCRDSKRKEFLVHRLVALAFIGDPDGMDVCHYDGDKLNNCIENLRIDTRKGNMADQIRMEKTPRGEKCGSNKYTADFVKQLKQELHGGISVTDLSNKYDIPKPTLYGIRSGANWGWL